jgi:uncharacterized protein YqeY
MDYLTRMSTDIIESRKAREVMKVKSLTMLKSKLLDNSKAAKPKEELAIIRMYMKQVGESLDAYSKDSDKYSKEIEDAQAEIGYIKEYLPKELSEDEVLGIANEVKKELGDVKFGVLMGMVMKKVNGQADGKLVKRVVESIL